MNGARRCPECGRSLAADAPQGLCPACLLGMAMAGGSGTTEDAPDEEHESGGETCPPLPSWAANPYAIPDSSDPSTDPDTYATRAEVETGSNPDAPPSTHAEPPAPPGYTILERLGAGGMGVVYKARQEGLNRLVAPATTVITRAESIGLRRSGGRA